MAWCRWINVDLSSMRSSDIHLRAILQKTSQPPIINISLKITYIKFHSNLLGVNELKLRIDLCQICHQSMGPHSLNAWSPIWWIILIPSKSLMFNENWLWVRQACHCPSKVRLIYNPLHYNFIGMNPGILRTYEIKQILSCIRKDCHHIITEFNRCYSCKLIWISIKISGKCVLIDFHGIATEWASRSFVVIACDQQYIYINLKTCVSLHFRK